MPSSTSSRMHQVLLGHAPAAYLSVSSAMDIDGAVYAAEHDHHEAILLRKCPADIWPGVSSYTSACPRPILMGRNHHDQLVALHEALVIAIVDIVQRWWSDEDADFPRRMPLRQDEEDLLKWIEVQVQNGSLPAYSKSVLGSLRPDFLVQDDEGDETFCLTEINARFCFNGFMHARYGQAALDEMGVKGAGVAGAVDGDELFNGLLDLFRHDQPLHLLKGEEKGIDIGMFIHAVQLKLGTTPRLITPADLRLVPDPEKPGQKKLCCLAKSASMSTTTLTSAAGEPVEEILQVGLELHQRELAALDPDMRRHLSLRCFNDMRTLLLVHDKRMLGLIRAEAPSLLARRLLTPSQARALGRGIAETALPGSPDLRELLRRSAADPLLKDAYLLKPIRGGKGAGILFGEDLEPEQWLAALQSLLQQHGTHLQAAQGETPTYVAQRKVPQLRYDVVLNRSGEMKTQPLVGTFHSVHGRYLGIGIWRSSGSRICAVSSGAAWLCSVMKSPCRDGMQVATLE